MYNYYREDWLIDRLAGTAAAAFGHTPCVDLPGGGQAVVTAALDEANQSCGTPYVPAGDRHRAGHRRPAVPVLPGRLHPGDLPVDARPGSC